jgi:hypothetical protein
VTAAPFRRCSAAVVQHTEAAFGLEGIRRSAFDPCRCVDGWHRAHAHCGCLVCVACVRLPFPQCSTLGNSMATTTPRRGGGGGGNAGGESGQASLAAPQLSPPPPRGTTTPKRARPLAAITGTPASAAAASTPAPSSADPDSARPAKRAHTVQQPATVLASAAPVSDAGQ